MTFAEMRNAVAQACGWPEYAAVPLDLRTRVDRSINESEGDIKTRAPWDWMVTTVGSGTSARDTSTSGAALKGYDRFFVSAVSAWGPMDVGKGVIHAAYRSSGGHTFILQVPPDVFFERAIESHAAGISAAPTMGTIRWDTKNGATQPELLLTPKVPTADTTTYSVRYFTEGREASTSIQSLIPDALHEILVLGAAWRVAACVPSLYPKVESMREQYEARLGEEVSAHRLRWATVDSHGALESGRGRFRWQAGRRDQWAKPAPPS